MSSPISKIVPIAVYGGGCRRVVGSAVVEADCDYISMEGKITDPNFKLTEDIRLQEISKNEFSLMEVNYGKPGWQGPH